MLIASAEGGVNIEEVAEANPDAVLKFPIDIMDGLSLNTAITVAEELGIKANRFKTYGKFST